MTADPVGEHLRPGDHLGMVGEIIPEWWATSSGPGNIGLRMTNSVSDYSAMPGGTNPLEKTADIWTTRWAWTSYASVLSENL